MGCREKLADPSINSAMRGEKKVEPTVTIIRNLSKKKKPETQKLGFGKYFSDHMFLINFDEKNEWHNPRILPYDTLPLEPAAAVLHYAQAVFENHKAFLGPAGEILLFRFKDYCKRLENSAHRLCLPLPPFDWIREGLFRLLNIDKDWIPSMPLTSLNIRHSIIATEPFLGVKPAAEYLYFIITGPVGAYYSKGFSPVKILVEEQNSRAAPGGLGAAKTGGNYAAGLSAQMSAAQRGYDQVLWLDACEKRFVEEVGAMNIFFNFEDELATPGLNNTILPGITRESVLTICRDLNLKVSERSISIQEVIEKANTGKLIEVFGTGTAAVIAPVSEIFYKGDVIKIADGKIGTLAQKIFQTLTDIQYGKTPDPYGWREIVEVA
jgi:branched-chain amino acid aminotransferase